MHLAQTASLTGAGVALAVAASNLVSPAAGAVLPEQAVQHSKPAPNSTLHDPTLAQDQKQAIYSWWPAAGGCPASGYVWSCRSQPARFPPSLVAGRWE